MAPRKHASRRQRNCLLDPATCFRGVISWVCYPCEGSAKAWHTRRHDQDLKACRESDPIAGLLKNLRQVRSALVAEPSDFSGALADRSGLLALYIACMHRGILDFYTGSKVLLQGDVDRHHVMPRGQFPDKTRATADNIANIAFIVGDVNKSIGVTGPEVYLPTIDTQVLKSQCIPIDNSLWAISRAQDFWAARRELLAESFNEFLRDSFPQRRLGSG